MMLAAAQNPGNPALAQFVFSVGSGLTVLLLAYLVRTIRKFMGDHKWLMETAAKHSEQIDSNTAAIRTMLEQREKLIEQRERPPRRQR